MSPKPMCLTCDWRPGVESVYIIGCDEFPARHKVGWTVRAVAARLDAFQLGCPVTLKVIAVIHGGTIIVERRLHRSLAEHMWQREWVDMERQQLLDHISREIEDFDLSVFVLPDNALKAAA